jgi:hypothetical protein
MRRLSTPSSLSSILWGALLAPRRSFGQTSVARTIAGINEPVAGAIKMPEAEPMRHKPRPIQPTRPPRWPRARRPKGTRTVGSFKWWDLRIQPAITAKNRALSERRAKADTWLACIIWICDGWFNRLGMVIPSLSPNKTAAGARKSGESRSEFFAEQGNRKYGWLKSVGFLPGNGEEAAILAFASTLTILSFASRAFAFLLLPAVSGCDLCNRKQS